LFEAKGEKMQTVKHKLFGVGEVIKKEGNYLTVRFQKDGAEKRFVIPDSFRLGILVAEGDLKQEVYKAMTEITKKPVESTYVNTKSVNTKSVFSSIFNRRLPKKGSKTEGVGNVSRSYEAYLINAGYKTETNDGKPSTVYAYIKAIDFVLREEHLSWEMLTSEISTIVSIYDYGGKKEHLGNKSNKTVINALKRFEEFVEAL